MIKMDTNIAALSFSIMSLLILTATIGPEAAAIKLTSTSYRDGITKGLNDATCDLNQCHGHGYDPSCPSGHTKTFCSGYAQGYSEGWDHQSGNDGSNSQAQLIGGNELGITGNNNHVTINQLQSQK